MSTTHGFAHGGSTERAPRSWRLRTWAPVVGLGAFGIALWALQRWLGGQHWHEVRAALAALPASALVLAVLLTTANNAAVAGYDLLALRHLGRRVPWPTVATTAFVANALGNNFGNTLITGAAVRYWSYTSAGVPGPDIARLVVFCSASFWLGYALLCGLVLSFATQAWPPALMAFGQLQPVAAAAGLGATAAFAGLVTLASVRGRPLAVGRFTVRMPSPRIAAAQVAVGAVDVGLMAGVLHVLLAGHGVRPGETLVAVLLATVAGNLSLVPGGLGVFESVVVVLFGVRVPPAALAAALLAYRAIYYVAPLGVAVLLLGARTGRMAAPLLQAGWHRRIAPSAHTLAALAPDLMAGAVFLAGASLLLTGSLPAPAGRLAPLRELVPLALIEASHFLASIAGAALLLLAHALQRRIDAAWQLAVLLLAAAAGFSLMRGWQYEEAAAMAALGGALLATRSQFRRRSSMLDVPFSTGWFAAGGIVVLAAAWLVFTAFRQPELAQQRWWSFALDAEAARSLRAAVGAATLTLLAGLHWLLGPARPAVSLPGAAELEQAGRIARASVATYANLVFRADKALMFDAAGESFLMYGRSGRSWVAMGDPVGTRAGSRELLWRFRDLCDRYDGWCVFFEVHDERRADYAEIGLVLTPLGEQARVDLQAFDLDGPGRRELRHARARLLRRGASFELVPPAGVPAILPELAAVSSAWLATRRTQEKGFSNASFDAGYLSRFPVAVVRSQGRIVAFANVWEGAARAELSIDLMRHLPEAPHGTMDLLFTELMLRGREQGWRWFDFGMAPLAGLDERTDAPLWGRVARLVYRHGEHFYNFEGLRRYKAKFGPVWTPLYLASPGGVALPAVLLDVTALIAGSIPGIVSHVGNGVIPRLGLSRPGRGPASDPGRGSTTRPTTATRRPPRAARPAAMR